MSNALCIIETTCRIQERRSSIARHPSWSSVRFALARGARRQRKVSHPSRDARPGIPPWGGAKRNPRYATVMKFQRAKRPIVQTLEALMMNRLSAASRAAAWYSLDPGVRSQSLAHPRLYAIAALRGLRQNYLHQLNQSFLQFVVCGVGNIWALT